MNYSRWVTLLKNILMIYLTPVGLVSGTIHCRQLHVVMAYNNVDREAIVITAYEPDPETWSENYSRRRL
jgi:hypothetical protein